MKICESEYASGEQARKAIETEIDKFYRESHPDMLENKKDLIKQAIKGLQEVYSENIFPEMKVRWNAYPNHIGHLEFNGCFRCHNDRHTSTDGKRIRKDCDLCHIISAQGSPGQMEYAEPSRTLEFRHPEDVGDAWKEMLCSECHAGLNP